MRSIAAMRGSIERRFAVTATDLNTGDSIAMTQENTTIDTIAQSCVASGSLPVVFPPQQMNGYVFMDGGMVWNVNLSSAVQQCMEIVDDYSDVIVDIAICGYATKPTADTSKNAMENFNNGKNLRDFYQGGNSVFGQAKAFPGIQSRYYFQEWNNCEGQGGLSFDNSTTWCLQEAGRKDAKDMLSIGSDNVYKTLEQWQDSQDLKKEYPIFRDYLN